MTAALRTTWWVALALVLLWAPIPLGSVNTQWSMPLAAACLVLGALRILVLPLREDRRSVSIPSVLLPFGILVAWFGFQLIPLPEGVVSLLSPRRLDLPPVPGAAAATPLSVYPGVTLEQGLLHLGLFYLMWSLVVTPSRAPFRTLAVVGFCHAVFALVLAQTGGTDHTRVMWLFPLPEVLTPFGTYVNKNHFAGLMVITGGACFGVLLRRISSAARASRGLDWRVRLSAITGRGFFRLLVPAMALLAISLAIFASGSRGAAAAFSVALLGVTVVAMLLSGRFRVWVVAVLGGVVVLLAVVASTGRSVSVGERLVPSGRYLNRPRLWRNTLEMALEYPVSGTGLGTFVYVFPRHQEVAPDREFTHAEGDWVQYAAEAGLVGVLALLAFGVALVRRVVPVLRRPGSRAALVTGGLVGLTGIVMHGMVDISLHVPANMVAATVLVGGILGYVARVDEPVEAGDEGG